MTDRNYLAGLNDRQKEAVFHTNGPLLVLAGAGSGKTRVLTTRIARLVKERHCSASEILAVTFTNKAAREMQERIASLCTAKAAQTMTVCTFHSLGVRILREFGDAIGFPRHFSIINDYERTATIKGMMRSIGKKLADENLDSFANAISLAKNGSIDSEGYVAQDDASRRVGRVFKAYENALRKRHCVDFDDLLLLPLRLFERFPDILEKYRSRFRFVSIDEFQDTNTVQMKLARLLAAPKNNIMVVGDDDQGIYSWRGAVIENILDFQHHFAGCTTVILDKNYRSTRQIVDAAHAVVAKNTKRRSKKIIAVNGDGQLIQHYKGDDEEEEAQWIANAIATSVSDKEFTYDDHAMLFRTNAMIRRFEEALRGAKVPYRTVGTISFFDRKEVKDIIAYMRFFANPDDEMSLERVLKVPDKGLSPATLEALDELASNRKTSLWQAVVHMRDISSLADAQRAKLASFLDFHARYSELFTQGNLAASFRSMLAEINYVGMLQRAYKEQGESEERMASVEELIHGLETFEARKKKGGSGLAEYLQEISLALTENDPEEEKKKRGVTLMTLHKSKGLEFPVVFLPGLDNAIIPSSRAINEGNIDEERRLFYVGMTRARKRLVLTWPATKIFHTKTMKVTPCRFLNDIPQEFLDGPFGEKEKVTKEEFLDDFFAKMHEKLGMGGETDKKSRENGLPVVS